MAKANTQDSDDDADFVVIQSKEKSRLPPEVIDAFGSVGLPSDFVATLYKMTNGNKSPAIEGSWDGYCPTLDEIGNQFGAGSYALVVEYPEDKETLKKKIRFVLGESYNDKFIRAQQVKRAIQQNPTTQNNDFDKLLDMQLKLKQLQGPQNQSNDMMPMVTLIMGFMNQMNEQNRSMIQVLTQNKPEQPTIEQEIRKLSLLRDAFGGFGGNGEKESSTMDKLVDAGIEVFKTIAPELVAKLNNPILAPIAVKRLESNEQFQEMKKNPDSKQKVLEYIRSTFPQKQAEKAIERAGLSGS